MPSFEQDAARDLVRAREDVRSDLMRARHRVSKMLLRNGIVYSGGDAWTKVHDSWLRSQRFAQPGRQLAYGSAYETMIMSVDRRNRLDAAIEAMAGDSSYTPVARRLGCLRGISTVTGCGLAVEIGDWRRFSGATIGAFVGLEPTENLVRGGKEAITGVIFHSDQARRPRPGLDRGVQPRPASFGAGEVLTHPHELARQTEAAAHEREQGGISSASAHRA